MKKLILLVFILASCGEKDNPAPPQNDFIHLTDYTYFDIPMDGVRVYDLDSLRFDMDYTFGGSDSGSFVITITRIDQYPYRLIMHAFVDPAVHETKVFDDHSFTWDELIDNGVIHAYSTMHYAAPTAYVDMKITVTPIYK
jgi:hypothetical protein